MPSALGPNGGNGLRAFAAEGRLQARTASDGARPEKIVLAYSGGLDTSVIIPWLRERYGAEVIALTVDVGQGEDLEAVRAKALASGASRVHVVDARREFVEEFIWPTLQAGAVYEGKYLLGTAMARPLIGRHLVRVAREESADAVAHGATGKGNDQVRFELAVKALAPDLRVIAPWREWELRSREDCIDYAEAHGVPVPATREKPYSRDRNLWHLSHEGGDLEDPGRVPGEDVLLWCTPAEAAPDEPEWVRVDFERGAPVALDGRRVDAVELLERLNELGARHGVGVVSMVENRLVGMKSRGVYETPGGSILVAAHRELESLVLDRATQHFKALAAERYAELVYDGLWYTPLREALDAFVRSTQERVTGSVALKLYKGSVQALAAESPYSLYRPDLATFGASAYDHADASGFIKLFGLPVQVRAELNRELCRQGGGEQAQAPSALAGAAGAGAAETRALAGVHAAP
ncbi:MAG: argininosuccinate synthase [Bacillota bacterium]|nr:argininosuccinate synthase [Bacillota bacterium]